MKLEDIGFYTLSDNRCKNATSASRMMRGELILTSACNFKCPYCRGQRKDLTRHLTLEEAKNIVSLWADDKLFAVRFSGGEPTVWKGLKELVSYAKERGIEKIAISTNGSASLDYYKELIEAGVNDFSISLDACCAAYGDQMAGGIKGAWEKVISNIKELAKLTYVTVGIVVTEDTLAQLKETVEYAHGLGVADIRIISAAQYNELLEISKTVPLEIQDQHKILKYRIQNAINGINVRGIGEDDSDKCWIALDDMVVMGNHHFPCVIHMREYGDPIGEVGPNMRKEREEWVKNHNTHEDPICKKNCLDCIVMYNNRYEGKI